LLTPGPTAGFGRRSGLGANDKSTGAYDTPM
jgi:hypothetical protein